MDNMGMSIYNGDWDFPLEAHDFNPHNFHFSFSLAQPMGYYPKNPSENGTLIQQISSMKCASARALYTMNTTYNQNVQTIAYSTKYLDLLSIPDVSNYGVADLPTPKGDPCIDYRCIAGAGDYVPREWPTASLVRKEFCLSFSFCVHRLVILRKNREKRMIHEDLFF